MLDVIVLIAMAITAAAFAAGLITNAGIALMPSVIVAVALYLVMAASYLVVARSARSSGGGDRLDELEEALEIIDGDLQRIDQVEDDVARLDLLTDRVERLDQAVNQRGAGGEIISGDLREELAAAFENVHARIEGLRADVEVETRTQREKIAQDLKLLEGLIKQLSRELTATTETATAAAAAARNARAASAPAAEAVETQPIYSAPLAVAEPEPEIEIELAPEPVILTPAEPVTLIEEEEALVAVEDEAVALSAEERVHDEELLGVLRQAIEGGRIDLYLQPIVTLPERKLCYYEGLTRLRTVEDDLVLPGSYLPVAERAGMMALVDNVLLVKSVQVLRRLGAESRIKGVFCNISMQSLLDRDFFPELVEFLEENSGLSESLIFEIGQPQLLGLTRAELGCLDTIGALGYSFSLDHVADLDLDLTGLRDRCFRYVKIDAAIFLHEAEQKGAPLPAGDLKAYFEEFDVKLIVEKVETEIAVAALLDCGVDLAQGYLFAEPQPMNQVLARELEDADAA